ncbi:hypothetical protein RhiirA1_539631 [Rhizophagus irregularis]|uniref:Uncharacterized protein n=1 Tax=Rhizophagus irregularis TaxID=588596 RepID=A0A2I1EZW7_9GLOM|nr:hypothetical protein RhiirA1_539631 [Rhizophagus irregularis]PKY27663.1 hypothetical protein RhiirB3_443452 [Rhizophagus irregularis]
MSCSKIFSGDLPELIYEIIKNFQNDYSTLYSCVLINRLWCRLAIPLLWENPFSYFTNNYNFIEVYLQNLNDDLKTKINEYQIIDYLLPSNKVLFNYPSFIRYLNIYKIIISIERWLKSNYKTSTTPEFKILINISLIKSFIENKVNLHTFEIEIICYNNYDDKIYDNILEIILQDSNFINNIKNLKFSILSSNTLIEHISQITSSQQNLKRILLGYYNLYLYQSLLLSKEFNCSNTLNTIIFYYVDFKGINNLVEIFEKLNVLESVHIIYCISLDSFIQQIINLTKPFKLKSLYLYRKWNINPLQLLLQLLQKCGNYLENLGYNSNYSPSLRQLLELITKYCRNIKVLSLFGVEAHIIPTVFDLIENIKQNLNYLSIDIKGFRADYNVKLLILQNLGKALPSKLEYLGLFIYVKANDFEVFLKNSQDTFSKKLVINNLEENGDILPYIKEHIMKKKRVKYLAIKDNFNGKSIDLFNKKDEVKEFNLYNIKVLNYDNLYFDIYRYVNEID